MLLLLTWIIVGYIAFILDENARHVLSDRDITISYEYISIAEGIKIQINNLRIKEGNAELAVTFKEKPNAETKAKKY